MLSRNLTEESVVKLLRDTSGNTPAEIAAKNYPDSSSDKLSDPEWEMAQNIFRIMAKDAEVRVCEALSLILKENPYLPHDLPSSHASDFNTGFLPADILNGAV